MAAYNTGILYQLVHSVSLLALALYARASATHITLPASLFAAGMVLFSGSLYVMAASGWAKLGMVTPFGGIALLGGWGSLLWAIR